MYEILIREDSLPEAYHRALAWLKHYGNVTDCEDWGCKQKEISVTIHIRKPLSEPMISKLFIGGPVELEQYCLEMINGILDFEIDKGNWSYTYHDRIKDQIPFIVEELKRCPSSRRAVISVRTKDDIGSSDPACMQHIQYFVRDDKLHCKVLFRSNDACKASFMNMFALIMLQKTIAEELGYEVGSYTHRANSFHCYEKDFETLKRYYNEIMIGPEYYHNRELAYNYTGEDGWKELMDEARPDILKKVEELKHR